MSDERASGERGEPGDEPSSFDLGGSGEPERTRGRRRARRVQRTSPAHDARVEAYRRLVETRGWIFDPPAPPRPLSSLFEHLTAAQLESLSA